MELENIQKKLFHEIAFLAVLKHFASSKNDFWPYLKWQKMEFGQKNFVKLIYSISRVFLAWTVLNFLAHHTVICNICTYPRSPWSQPLMTCPDPNVNCKGSPLGMLESNSVPSSNLPY